MTQDPPDDASWDATLESPIPGQSLSEATILCFSILWHPDTSRIGAIAPISFDRSGTAILSRLTPDFHDRRAPLLDRHVSRSEIVLERDNKGRFSFKPRSYKVPIVVNGYKIEESQEFEIEELGKEIIIMLGNSVILTISKMFVREFQKPVQNEFGLVGISHSISKTRSRIGQLADTRLPVLILGETGTGKELVARALHNNSGRAHRALTTVNMAAISPNLATAELFGSKKGAFTGAMADNPGLFQLAHKGTLFLDEIGDAPPDLQAMLLRVLESGEVMPVGGHATVNVDVRIIAATDKILDTALAKTDFNQPLFQRLNVAPIELPPLRHRRVDIGLLIKHFLSGAEDDLPPLAAESVPASEVYRMALDDWPGNVRQLFNAVRRLRLGERYSPERESPPVSSVSSLQHQTTAGAREAQINAREYRNPLDINEKDLLAALDDCDWVIKEAARQLRVSRTSLYQLMSSCEAIRSINDVPESEIIKAMDSLDGGISAWAKHLRVGREALRKRIVALQSTL